MPDWGGGLFTAFMAAKDVGKGQGGGGVGTGTGGGCGPPYTESMDHEFEPDSGTGPGGVDLSHYCRICGVVGSMHGGGGGGGAAGTGRGGPQDPDDDEEEGGPQGGDGRPGTGR